MSEELVIRQCAPTLAGIKSGSLFPCAFSSRKELADELRRLNARLVPKGLCLMPLKYDNGRVLLYLFRPAGLRRDLGHPLAMELLRRQGYVCGNCGRCVAHLCRRMRENRDFPHEVGLFLSYPPEDVLGFMENRAENCKCAGLWKVYGDEKRAQELFTQFKSCTEDYRRRMEAGDGLDELAVAV